MNQNHLEGPLYRLLGTILRYSDSVNLGVAKKICLSNFFPGGADAAGLGTVH